MIKLRRILWPTDFFEHAQQTLVYAKEIAAFYGACLQLLHVVEEIVHPACYMASGTSVLAFKPELKASAMQEMKNF